MLVLEEYFVPKVSRYRLTFRALPWIILAMAGALALYWDGLMSLGPAWSRPEYSYGPIVPFITGYLILREIQESPVPLDTSSRLVGLITLGLALFIGAIGGLARVADISTYGFILFLGALLLLVAGTRGGLRFWPGWLHLIFMLPLPQFIYLHVSTSLQLVSSEFGVHIIQLFGIPVLLDGNIIDLGIYKLQVAEACSGLRYLFPLFSFGWIIAVLYQGARWHKVIIFLSTIPITIVMNSVRIGIIGILVNSYGISQAEGFLHLFEGWVIFISCTVVLYIEAWALARFFSFGSPRPSHTLNLDFGGVLTPLKGLSRIGGNAALVFASVMVVLVGAFVHLVPPPMESQVARLSLQLFPMQIGSWQGQRTPIDPDVERVLAADDYLVANYVAGDEAVNLLLTFYKSQTAGSGIHSPEVCLPGGGWEVSNWEQVPIDVSESGMKRRLYVNRAVIQKGTARQLVYYWFEERGQQTTNEFEAKFMSVRDTMFTGRSDGGLVRLVTPIRESETIQQAAHRLDSLLGKVLIQLPKFYPGYSSD